MTYQRRILSGGTRAPVKPRNVPKLPSWFRDWNLDELAMLDVVGGAIVNRETEREHAKRNVTTRSDIPTPPTQSAHPLRHSRNIRQVIRLRQQFRNLWRKSAGSEDFRTRLIAMLLEMLTVARQTHHPDDCARIEAELRQIGQEPPAA